MDDRAALERENEALRERLSRLSAASLRINQNLDVDAALQDVLDSARALTDARHGVITLIDEAGRTQDFLASGLTAEESAQLWQTPEGERIFAALTTLAAPLRLPDVIEHVRGLGFSEFILPVPVDGVYSFLAAPLLHRGGRVGHVFVGDKTGGRAFSRTDEETLVMFAAQAALVIGNARRHREEQRARADLETLIEISPVGVAVLDARTAATRSVNREGRRIVDAVSEPGQPPDELLRTLRYRRADGREYPAGEFLLARALSSGETLRAEEITLEAPDGRQARVIVNATPIRTADGSVESVIATFQDLAPLEELARMRTDFLAMVSHELRVPLSSIRGSATTLITAEQNLDPAAAGQFYRIIDQQSAQMEVLITDLLDVARIESGELEVRPEPVALETLVEAAAASFRTGGAGAGTVLEIELPDGLARILADRRRIVQVLVNLFVNAARHSPGVDVIRLTARQHDVELQITVADDGVGIEPERLKTLFQRPGRAERGAGLRPIGRGLGLAIAKGIVEAHGGRIWAESPGPGEGAQFHFTLPAVEPAALPPEPGSVQPTRGQFRILALDDDPQTLRYLRESLTEAGFDPVLTGDPESLRPLIAEHRPHLVLLDLVLPESDGMELLERLPELQDRPVIFLSAYGGDQRVARALELGADDYIVKPFSPTELIARIKTVLRRATDSQTGPAPPTTIYRRGDLEIDYAEEEVRLAGRPLTLTYLEQRLLIELSKQDGEVLSHAQLLPRVWGPAHSGRTGAVRTLVKQLRRKLGDDAEQPSYIFNVPRLGYHMLESERPDGPPADE